MTFSHRGKPVITLADCEQEKNEKLIDCQQFRHGNFKIIKEFVTEREREQNKEFLIVYIVHM